MAGLLCLLTRDSNILLTKSLDPSSIRHAKVKGAWDLVTYM